ncbi:membrane protein [Mycobacterium phage Yecey3]|uniref:Membrane protein n=1 Tax=Mycobacterium phage Yecey3 TaxID=2656617 RepID=A0A649VAI4_9CAUD|nr:membrane protein [Mycobacterium phage Yecey3]QGJ88783.1 membrane protein [Mycobacterium phage Yecey3]
MTGLFNPDTPLEAALLAFVALCTMLGLVLPVYLTQRSQNKKLNQINDQVSNTHDENLRDEITRGFKELQTVIADHRKEVREDINGLREELRTERVERIEGDRLRVVVNNQRG